ncbi:cellulose binding domain-containing protein [Streptomyces sp. NBC_01717]|uniref:cellulose binding domain-containing protein n=1 Tax=Streptomyces sp. NBC_01717 TaxID=2975918 RepID=UPI002E36F2D9|nr:cellulose binding domain-containing protein [Streptomyces sp. NBC_01717]
MQSPHPWRERRPRWPSRAPCTTWPPPRGSTSAPPPTTPNFPTPTTPPPWVPNSVRSLRATRDNGASSYGTWCDRSPLGCATITHRVAAASAPKAGADHYLEVGFGSGSPATGAPTGEIQLRLSRADWSNFDETDDCSRTTVSSYADAPKVAVHIGGELA